MGIYLGSALPATLTAPSVSIEKIKAIAGTRLKNFWLADKAKVASGAFTWPDLITGIAMTQTQAAAQYVPDIVTDGGLPAVSMKGAGLRLNQAFAFSAGYTFLFILKPADISGVQSLLGSAVADKMIIDKNNPARTEIRLRNGAAAGTLALSGAGISPNLSWHASTIAWDDAADQATFGVDKVLNTPVAYAEPVLNSTDPIMFAAGTSTTQSMPGCLVRGVLVFDRDMTRGVNAADYARLLAVVNSAFSLS